VKKSYFVRDMFSIFFSLTGRLIFRIYSPTRFNSKTSGRRLSGPRLSSHLQNPILTTRWSNVDVDGIGANSNGGFVDNVTWCKKIKLKTLFFSLSTFHTFLSKVKSSYYQSQYSGKSNTKQNHLHLSMDFCFLCFAFN
jgi:hypothetical protein